MSKKVLLERRWDPHPNEQPLQIDNYPIFPVHVGPNPNYRLGHPAVNYGPISDTRMQGGDPQDRPRIQNACKKS